MAGTFVPIRSASWPCSYLLGPSPDKLRPAEPDDSTTCVWDLTVIDFERRAWHELVVKQAGAPDLVPYLARRYEETV